MFQIYVNTHYPHRAVKLAVILRLMMLDIISSLLRRTLVILSHTTDDVLLLDREFLTALKVTRLDKSFVKWVISAGQEDVEWNCIKTALERSESCNDEYSLENGMVCYKYQIWIPDNNALRLLVASS